MLCGLETGTLNCQALEFRGAEFQANRETELEAGKLNGQAIEFKVAELQADREIVLAAVQQDGGLLLVEAPGAHGVAWASVRAAAAL